MPTSEKLPKSFKPMFWEYEFSRLRWPRHRHTIVQRFLDRGDLEHLKWLRERIGYIGIEEWLRDHRGGGLSPRHLRYWQVILGLPEREVTDWIRRPGRFGYLQ